MTEALELLDNLYSSELGCVPDDFNSGKILTVSNGYIGGIRFAKGIPLVLFAITRTNSTVVSVHPVLKDATDRIIGSKTAIDCEAYDALEQALNPLVDTKFWFRGCRLYCSPVTFLDKTIGIIKDVTHFDELSKTLHAKWGGPVYGQIVDGKVVAWAAVKPLSDIGWDLSIQTLPEYRGQGYAKSVVSAAVKYIFKNGKLATWGTDTTNAASLSTAHSVGFQDYGLDFGCVGRIRQT